MKRSAPDRRIPSIIELWLSASEKIAQSGSELAQRAERGEVGDPSRCEDQRGFLAVKVGEFGFELDMLPVGAGDVARSSGAGARQIDGAVHGRQHIRMLTHAEVVVAAPDGDAAAPTVRSVPQGRRELPCEPLAAR